MAIDKQSFISKLTKVFGDNGFSKLLSLEVSEKFGNLRWTVETDRGIKSFEIRNRNHDIKVYGDGRVRVRDSDDNRYTISDYRELDSHSRKLMIADL